MEAHRQTELTASGLRLRDGDGARAIPLWSGEVHYWRVSRAAWGACLAGVKRLGVELVAAPVPWGVHEQDGGALDWSGARDLGAFLDEVAAAGLLAVLRPGPHGELTLTGGGYPARVLRDPAMQAVTARGTPAWCPAPPRMFPLPSPASAAFRGAVGRWLAAVAEVVAPRLHPRGPVVALDVRAGLVETARLGAYDLDYHPDALAWWREDADADHGDPPRAWDAADAARCAAWVRWKERYAARAMTETCRALDAAGLGGVARWASAGGRPDAIHLPSLAVAAGGTAALAVDVRAPEEVRRAALYLGGGALPVPIAAAVPVGAPAWIPPQPPAREADQTAALLAGGARGLSFSMAVERERWVGAAVSARGELSPRGEEIAALLRRLRQIGWTSLRRRVAAAVVVSRADARFGVASSLIDPLPPLLGDFARPGPAGSAELALDRAAALHRRWVDAVIAALDRARLPFALLDEDAPDDEASPSYRLLVAPTLARASHALRARLCALSARNLCIVIGPERPTRDELDRPVDATSSPLPRRVGLLRPGSLDDPDGLARDLSAAAAGWDSSLRLHTDSPGQLSVFEDEAGSPRMLAIRNPLPSVTRARVVAARHTALCDLATGERMNGQDECVDVSVPAHSHRLLAVEHTGTTRAPR